ncbi:MAG: peptidoglycan DD-metalloendopeptidase family protein [Dethiobacteria bacterium]
MIRFEQGYRRGYIIAKGVAILLVMVLITCTLITPVWAGENKSIDEARQEQERIEQQKAAEEEKLQSRRSREEELKEELNTLDRELRKIRMELNRLNREIRTTEKDIAIAEHELREAEERLKYQEELLAKRLRVMYKRGNVSYLEVLLESSSFADMLTRFYYLKVIADNDLMLIEKVEEERSIIIAKKEELEEKKGELESARRTVADKKEEADRNVAARSRVLNELNKEIQKIVQHLSDLEEAGKKLEDEIKRLNMSGGQRPTGALLWPVEGKSYLTSKFGPRWGQLHAGIDIGTYGEAKPILAAESGEVFKVVYSLVGYGNHVVVNHGGGMTTLYAHMSSISVKKGQSVRRGDRLGKAGNTGHSFGVHLHFEVRINGVPVDPYGYL